MAFFEITRWYGYRRIKHPDMVHVIWTWPCILTAFFLALYLLSPAKPDVIGHGGLIAGFVQLLATLPGFFIAALAAIAALANPSLDKSLDGDAPTLITKIRGRQVQIDLNVRQFLLLSTAYAAMVSLLLTVMSVVISVGFSAQIVESYMGSAGVSIFSAVLLAVFSYCCCSLLVTTAHTVYFLAEGAHLPF